MKLPKTPAELTVFIGHNYSSVIHEDGKETKYVLSEHDLLAAFAELERESEDEAPASDLETVARALAKYDSECVEMPADELWAMYSNEYMRDAESSMAVLAPLFERKREAGYQAGYLDGMAKGKADALTPENQLPLATEDEKIAGWTFSYRFLEQLSDTIDYRPTLEAVESILLNAKLVCIAMQNPAVQPVAGQQHTPEIGQ